MKQRKNDKIKFRKKTNDEKKGELVGRLECLKNHLLSVQSDLIAEYQLLNASSQKAEGLVKDLNKEKELTRAVLNSIEQMVSLAEPKLKSKLINMGKDLQEQLMRNRLESEQRDLEACKIEEKILNLDKLIAENEDKLLEHSEEFKRIIISISQSLDEKLYPIDKVNEKMREGINEIKEFSYKNQS